MKNPNIYTVEDVRYASQTLKEVYTGVWVPARPESLSGLRMRLMSAWLVFSGKADALIWPGDQ